MEDNKLATLLLHVNAVQENCLLLGTKLIEEGEVELGRRLIANGRIHDYSKFFGIEFEYLNDNRWPYPDNDPKKELFLAALDQHTKTNLHHPEAWNGIQNMPRIYLAELVCDWKARSSEQGTDLREWIKEKATKRFKFKTSGRVYKEINYFLDLLLQKKFA